MSRPPQFVVVITALVVAAAILPAVGVGAPTGGTDDPVDAAAPAVPTVESPTENDTAVSLWAGPPGLTESVDDADDLPDHIGNLSRQSNVVPPNGSFVVRLRLPGLDEQVRNATGTNRTERFLSVADGPALNLRLWAWQDGAMETRFAALSPANATVVRGDSPDTYHLVTEPRDLPAVPATDDTELQYVGDGTGGPLSFAPSPAELEQGPHEPGTGRLYFTADLERQDGPPEHARLTRTPPTLTVAPRAPGIALVDRTGATVHGTTSLPPGTSVDVRVETADGEAVATTTATVRANSSGPDIWPGRPNGWSTTIDATELPDDADLSVVASADWGETQVTERVDTAVVPNESLAEPRLRLQRVSNDTDPTNLPDYVGLHGPSTPTVLLSDDPVVTVQSAVIAAEVEDAPGDNLTERFGAAWAEDMRLLVGYDYRPGHAPPSVFDLADTANVTVVTGDAPATYHVVPDRSAADIFRGEPNADTRRGGPPYATIGSTYLAGFNLFDEFAPQPTELSPNRTAEIATPDATITDDSVGSTLLFRPSTNLTVTGETTLPLSVPLTVELIEVNSSTVLARERTTPTRSSGPRWRPDSNFAATFEYDAEQGVDYVVRVVRNGTVMSSRVPLEVVPREASLTFDDQTSQWGATLNGTNLTHGGFVVLRNGSIDGELLASPEYVYPRDTRAIVQFDEALANRTTVVAVAYRDVDANATLDAADEPYLEDGEPVTATAVIQPPDETATTTPRSVVDTPATTSPEPTPTLGMADPNGTDDDGSVPGFGISGTLAALLALCALVVLRHR